MAQLPISRGSPNVARRKPSFIARKASGGLAAMRAANAIARGTSASCGTTSDTRPDSQRFVRVDRIAREQ